MSYSMKEVQAIDNRETEEPDETVLTLYKYKVRRQTEFLDNSTKLKRATTYGSYEPLNVGGLYILQIGKTRGFYRIEALLEEWTF